MAADASFAHSLLIPVLCSLGNIVAGGGAKAVAHLAPPLGSVATCTSYASTAADVFTPWSPTHDAGVAPSSAPGNAPYAELAMRSAKALLHCLACAHGAVQKEAAWVLANLAGLPGRCGLRDAAMMS